MASGQTIVDGREVLVSTNQATMTFFARSMAIGMLAGAPDTMPELAFRRKRKWKPRLSKHNHRPVIGPSKYITIFFRLLYVLIDDSRTDELSL